MTYRFRIRAVADPATLPRLLAPFAQRGLIPSSIAADQLGDRLDVVIEHQTMPDHTARLIASQIEAMLLVGSVSHRRW